MSSYEILNVKNIYDEIAHEFNKTRGYYWKPITDFIDNLENYSNRSTLDFYDSKNQGTILRFY